MRPYSGEIEHLSLGGTRKNIQSQTGGGVARLSPAGGKYKGGLLTKIFIVTYIWSMTS